jgi:hypothetical protein
MEEKKVTVATLMAVVEVVKQHFDKKIEDAVKAVENKIPAQQTEEPVDTDAVLEEVKKILG